MVDVLIVLGSRSDRDVAEKAAKVLDRAGIDYDVRVASAHRTPERIDDLIEEYEPDVKVYIAIAGLAAHLPGVIAAKTLKPVIAVPVEAKLGGLDALLSTVQMPPGVPVAVVGVDRGENAALLALQILALENEDTRSFLEEYREEMKKQVTRDDDTIKERFR
ncbi:5-(carboxyamino)imidazole ribonucleotide mutase [Methanopyrus sp. KOL6]|uniref:5-(carboxyamino)imidazole ribonucleotide mutase n=1 Tax=Methanopyrus sp. KOL6 TaxID=1937004 RepID=UPI000B4C174E|nr:5-(carboxyamino)imidazole ribonucleotide mutase [Methanopyrus sp. KOL6]